ncbi:MAG: sugar ABC transporter permease [Sphaerochaeta sp.]|jgi:multiple sugar transport system permease protein|nr:sugar ABC transporter permease [Sphaerochaeta sp.]
MNLNKTIKKQNTFWIVAFLLPNTILYAMYTVYPAIATAWYSLLDWTAFQRSGFFYGLNNYIELIHDDLFHASMKATFKFMLIAVPLRFLMSLFLALLLTWRRCIGKTFFRTLLFLPVVTTGAIIGTIMKMIFDPKFGPINIVLNNMGLLPAGFGLLSNFSTSLGTSATIWSWKWMGMSLIYWIASLQSIPTELYEAATVDGASPLQAFRMITAPLLKPFAGVILILTVGDSLRVFDLMLTLTNGGPYFATEAIELFIYHTAFADRVPRLGYASAAATVFASIFVVITLVQNFLKNIQRGYRNI